MLVRISILSRSIEATGQPLYNKMKGTFAWAKDVRPELLYYDGKWDRAIDRRQRQVRLHCRPFLAHRQRRTRRLEP